MRTQDPCHGEQPQPAGRRLAGGAAVEGSPYNSFWQAGFEGADHVNGRGRALDMNRMSGHLARASGDYRRLAQHGLLTARESLGWRVCEHGRGYDFGHAARRERCAARAGVQILWTLFHYGRPADLCMFEPGFHDRFVRYCAAAARFLKPLHTGDRVPVYTPVNEISFLSWAACETGLIHPYAADRIEGGYRLKQVLVRATLAAMDAITEIDARARFLLIDPLLHVACAAQGGTQSADEHQQQFQAWDMLCGKLEPQLGGHPHCLDLVGANYYPHNQWEAGTRLPLEWPGDPRRRALGDLLLGLHERYRRPITLSETGHVGARRAPWLEDVATQVLDAQRRGAAIDGVCLYPVVDRPDWEEPGDWHDCGLWAARPPRMRRTPHPPLVQALRDARAMFDRNRNDSPRRTAHMDTLIVFSHLRWNFVYQRPQHLLGRIASRWRIVFVEEPVRGDGDLQREDPVPGVTVLRPRVRREPHGFDDAQSGEVAGLLQAFLAREGIVRYGAWLYTPMALPLLSTLEPEVIVYDCMDELAAFKDAPQQLLAREQTLLQIAGVVFTGGPALYDAKRHAGAHVHCLPSSVDAAHFARGAAPGPGGPCAHVPRPRLGYYGVIDERLDLDLLAAVADADADWQVCVVGPVAKIDPADLPQRPNLHYFPQQPYETLPDILAGWQVCLMPFALNASTRFISPTKTLEYMSADRPVVSTAVTDVRRLYADGVHVATDTAGFIAACREALAEGPEQQAQRRQAQQHLVEATSWDAAAARVVEAIERARARGLGPRARDYLDGRQVVPLQSAATRRDRVDCLIVGAGPTGLSAAYHHGAGSLTVDANDRVGGWCRSIEDRGFVFDHAGHIMFSRDPDVLALYDTLLGENVHWQDREAWVYSKGVHTRYPFQGALYGLPPDVLVDCLMGAIEAHAAAGTATAPAPGPAANSALQDCCADGVAPESRSGDAKDGCAPTGAPSVRLKPRNFEEFIYQTWGAGVARHFAIPYNRKLWTVPLQDMETSWLGGRVPLPDLREMIEGAVQPVARAVGPNARFGYPLKGGFQALMDAFVPHLQGELSLSTRLVSLDLARRLAYFDDGRSVAYSTLVSTIPLPQLVAMLGSQAPPQVREAALGLRHVSIRCVNLGIARERITDKHWIYYPEDTLFHRIFLQGNASPHNNPPGGFGLTCEISYSPHKPLPADDAMLIQRCIEDCHKVGMLRGDDRILVANTVDMPYAYVIYDHARSANVARIRNWLAGHDVILAGRYSEWEYYNSDHAFLAGRTAALAARATMAAGTQRA